jgi:putative peptidoglycan lipid II flippase
LLSNALLVPLLPVYARLTAPEDRPQLIARIRQGLMLSNASMLPLGALMIGLAGPIVALVYQRGAFDQRASTLVASLLVAYGVGMPAYLARDVLVRVFYALGDANTPFRWSVGGIGLNALFDWVLVGGPTPGWGLLLPKLYFGAPGLVLATALVNIFTGLGLLLVLHRRLGGLPLGDWGMDSLKLLLASVVAGGAAWALAFQVHWPAGLFGLLLQNGLCAALAVGIYGVLGSWSGVEEVRDVLRVLRLRRA